MEVDNVLADEELKSRLAAVGAGILVIIAGFLVYNYFSNVGDSDNVLREGAQTDQMASDEEDTGNEAVMGEDLQDATDEGTTQESTDGEDGTGGPEASYYWTATDYKEGDISGEQYTVKEGDTLWEIAEARYGSGFEWTKIRDANSDQIGMLPNGTQALINPGQTLTLP